MNRIHTLISVAVITLGTSSTWSDAHAASPSTPQNRSGASTSSQDRDNDIHALDLTPAESAKARADAAAARAARQQSTRASRAASAEQRKNSPALDRYPDNDSHALNASASQAKLSRTEAAAAKTSRSTRTKAEKRAVQAKKQKDLDVVQKSGPGS